MREVKEEAFGSRNSILEDIFIQNNIRFIKNLWFVTCRYKINKDINTRYLVLLEDEQYINLEIFNEFIDVYDVCFAENGVFAKNRRTKVKRIFTLDEFKKWIIDKTNCKFVESQASGSDLASPLSRFFRENMGKGFSLTDVDFFITEKSVFVEEKTFIQDGVGLLGHGQYISFKEIKKDICPNIDFHIILNDGENFYIVNLDTIDPDRIVDETKWGKMIEFDLGRKYTIDEIIEKYK